MEALGPVAVGASLSLIGVVFGAWFTARRQDRMWLREQKLKAAVTFNTTAGELYDHLRHGRSGDEARELRGRMQEGRSTLHLLCGSDTVELADALADRVLHVRPTHSEEEHLATLALLRRHTRQLRREIGA